MDAALFKNETLKSLSPLRSSSHFGRWESQFPEHSWRPQVLHVCDRQALLRRACRQQTNQKVGKNKEVQGQLLLSVIGNLEVDSGQNI